MATKLIADSCCDLTPQLKKQLNITSIPLTMRVDETEFVDDPGLDLDAFMDTMKSSPHAARSASPTPHAYLEAFLHPGPSYAITLSKRLSGSYASATLAQQMASDKGCKEVHVFDSRSASAGEVLVALKARALIDQGIEHATLVDRMEAFIARMKTFFVLENYSNLEKNGRLCKLTGKLISVLNIKLVMGSDGEGDIALYGKPRGKNNMLGSLIVQIEKSGKKTEGEQLVISHCNNPSLAEELAERIRGKFHFADVLIVPAGGLTSLYADDKGIVMAF